jgi:hypothetical protein
MMNFFFYFLWFNVMSVSLFGERELFKLDFKLIRKGLINPGLYKCFCAFNFYKYFTKHHKLTRGELNWLGNHHLWGWCSAHDRNWKIIEDGHHTIVIIRATKLDEDENFMKVGAN